MQSNQDPQTGSLTSTSIRPELPTAPTRQTNPQAADILKELQKGDNPVDFIMKNLRPMDNLIKPEVILEEASQKHEAQMVQTHPLESPKTQIQTGEAEIESVIKGEVPKEVPAEPTPEAPIEEEKDLSVNAEDQTSLMENLRRLNTKAKETSKTLKQREEELTKAKEELEQYKTGQTVPEVLQEMQNRISELEKYEKLHNLKMSRDYQEAFVKPVTQVTNRLKELATDYSIPEDVLNQAVDLTNEAELNGFLSNHFDMLGAQEVKGLIKQLQTIKAKEGEAIAEPQKIMEELSKQSEQIQAIRKAEKFEKISSNAKKGWLKAVQRLRSEGKIKELIPSDVDEEFNQKIVNPLMVKASQEYGRMVKIAAENGLEELPDELAEAWGALSLIAHSAAVAITSREQALQYAQEVEKSAERYNSIIRPKVGSPGGVGESAPPAPRVPQDAREAGRLLAESILSKKK